MPAGVAELADAQDLGSCDASRGGSSPSARTIARSQGGLADGRGIALRCGSEADECRSRKRSSDGLKRELKVVDRRRASSTSASPRASTRSRTRSSSRASARARCRSRTSRSSTAARVMAEVLQQAVEETSRKAHQGAQGARRAPAQHQPHRGQGRDRARAVGPERSRLHHVLRGAARDQDHRPRRAQARARGGRRHADEAVDKAVGELAERAIRYEVGGGPCRRRRRPRDHRLRRPHRRRRVRGRQGRGRAAGARPVAASFRASSRA